MHVKVILHSYGKELDYFLNYKFNKSIIIYKTVKHKHSDNGIYVKLHSKQYFLLSYLYTYHNALTNIFFQVSVILCKSIWLTSGHNVSNQSTRWLS